TGPPPCAALALAPAGRIMESRGVRAPRRVASPPGDAPVVIADVTLENTGGAPVSLRHYELWDVGRRPIEINWLVSGIPFSSAPATARQQRDARNAMFDEAVSWDPAARLLGLRRRLAARVTPSPRAQPSDVDDYPGDPFLAVLAGDVADAYTDQASFFGGGGVAAPDAVTSRLPGQGLSGGMLGAKGSGMGQPRVFVLRS